MDGLSCDALLVLGGEDLEHWPRCTRALKLYWAQRCLGNPPPKLVVSGGKVVRCDLGTDSEAALMAVFLRSHGVDPVDILVEPQAMNTLGNVVLGGQLALRHGNLRLGLVTDDYHHWRSIRLYMRVFGKLPEAVLGTGDQGTWPQRMREVVSYVRLEWALQVAKVPKREPNQHVMFLKGSLGYE